jgi:hypothetical protein
MAEPFRDDLLAELLAAARSLNEYVPPERTRSQPVLPLASVNGAHGDRPGDAFNRSATWEEILEPHGWAKVRQFDRHSYWRRPGKVAGVSATADYCRSEAQGGLLYVFSSGAAPLEMDTGYSRFAAFTVLNHGGNFAEAAKAISANGYGKAEAPINFCLKGPAPVRSPVPQAGPPPTSEAPDRIFLWASELRVRPANDRWVWHGILSRGGVTLLSALWKAGKTTLLAHALRAMAAGGDCCGLAVKPAKVLVVSEEDEEIWAARRDELGLADHLGFLCRPFKGRPTMNQWQEFLKRLRGQVEDFGFDVLVLDTLAKLWPVRDENDAVQVDDALMPAWQLCEGGRALWLNHHLRKSDGMEATASRGSGALTAFVETIVELRRFSDDKHDTRRVLTGIGRWRETPHELVINLTARGYASVGEPSTVRSRDDLTRLLDALPDEEPGMTRSELETDLKMAGKTIRPILTSAVENGLILPSGSGQRGDPRRYRRAQLTSHCSAPPIGGTEQATSGAGIEEAVCTLLAAEGNLWSAAEVSERLKLDAARTVEALERLAGAGRIERRSDFDVPTYAVLWAPL